MERDLSERMLEYRAKHNLSQEEFAEKAKLCLMTISAIETNKRPPNPLTRAKIEMVLKEED